MPGDNITRTTTRLPDGWAKREITFRQDPDDVRTLGAEMAHDFTLLRCLAAAAATIIANCADPELARLRFAEALDEEALAASVS